MSDVAILVLAAGASRRLGMPKQLIEIEGETLIHRIAREALESNAAKVLIVLGHETKAMRLQFADLDVATTYNPSFAKGMGTSIRHGVAALADHEAILISVCDQPHLTKDVFNDLMAALDVSETGIIASRYAETLGVPAVFAKQHFSALLSLPDDAGAKRLITTHDVEVIDFPFGGVDIDTGKDLASLER